VHAVAKPPLEPVGIQQGHERLEVLLLARVRRRGHQQQVAGDAAEEATELVPLGQLELAAVVVRRHAVRLVDDDKVVRGGLDRRLEVVGARKHVHPRDE